MKRTIVLITCALLASIVHAQQVPFAAKNMQVSNRDRVYTADQTSNTVSVIDPFNNKSLGVIRLGDPVPGSLSALYKGALLVHGLGYSPDSRILVVVSVGSNSVTFVETATNKVMGTVYVGRAPHEAMFRPDGKEVWVTVRGENYVSVIDPVLMKETRRILLSNGPGMTMFRPDGKYAFVCSSFTPDLAVIDTGAYQVVQTLKQASSFCPDIAVSPEGDEVWITLKDAGKVQVFSGESPFPERAVLDTGPITNHVNLLNNPGGKFAYVTVGGTNQVKVFSRGPKPQLVATIPVGDLPHGLWPSGDGSRIYVALENGGAVAAIETSTNKVIANIPIGQTAQALMYVPNAVEPGNGSENLKPFGEAARTVRLEFAADPSSGLTNARASAAVNSLGLLDLVEIAASGLESKKEYQVYLADSNQPPFGRLEPLALLKANPDGGAVAQAVGPLKTVAGAAPAAANTASRRFLIITPKGDTSRVVLRQITGQNGQ